MSELSSRARVVRVVGMVGGHVNRTNSLQEVGQSLLSQGVRLGFAMLDSADAKG